MKTPGSLCALCLILLTGCLQIGPMRIERLVPDRVEPGDVLSIRGAFWGTDPDKGQIFIGDVSVPRSHVLDWGPSRIDIRVPEGVEDGDVHVVYQDRITPPSWLTVLPPGTLQARIVAFGDSLTWGQGGSWGSYVSLLEILLQEAGYRCALINEGRPGETTAEGLERLPSVLQRWNRADILLVLEGTNDVADVNRVAIEETIENLREMIHTARDDYGFHCLLATPIPRAEPSGDLQPPTTEQVVEAIQSLSREESVPLADLYHAFCGIRDWKALYRDPVHPNPLGALAMAQAWSEALRPTALSRY